jgi:four helix bundle protein
MFNHERLDVYRMAVQFDAMILKLLPRRGLRALKDQLERASCSVMACIAEGAGRWAPAEKRHFYSIARGSATECAAHLDALRNRQKIRPSDYQECRNVLLSIVRILTKLSINHPEPELEPEP